MTGNPFPPGDEHHDAWEAATDGQDQDQADRHREMFPAPNDPMAVARQLMPAAELVNGQRTLRHWRSTWMRWERSHWSEVDVQSIRSEFYQRLEHAVYEAFNSRTGELEVKRWAPTKRKIADLTEAVAAILHLPGSVDAPSWLEPGDPPAGTVVACANGLLHVDSRKLYELDPRFFNLVSVPFGCDAAAPVPARWLEFLHQAWPDDPDSIATLQEWFGYVLSGRTDLHKILLIVGPTRSGKGTLARILTALVGKANMAGPTLASLGTQFGLSPLLGKPLAVVSDARLGGRDSAQVVERLLTVSGEDTIDVDRKFRDPWTGRLPTRFLILSNELPNFGDASGTIARRFLVLNQRVSWLGKENPRLTDQLAAELPGILNWALDGLERLTTQGRFTEPESSRDSVTMMMDTASPMSAFVRECCETGAGKEVLVDDLFTAWKTWCEDNERKPGNRQMFARNLRSVTPQIKVIQPRVGDGGRVRLYQGIAIRPPEQGDTRNSAGRVPSRANDHPEPVARDDTRSIPLRVQHWENEPVTDCHCGRTPDRHAPGDWGPCTRCGTRHHRYGPGGRALCDTCTQGSDAA